MCKLLTLRISKNNQKVEPLAEIGKESVDDKQARQTRWGRIYASVVGFTVVVILLLYFFSQHYSG
ncbi:MAG: hypothetical protein ACR2Q3_03460 [Woeseiaceae bacterium]